MTKAFAITDVDIVTGDAAGTIERDQTIVVGATGTITAVGPAAETDVPRGYQRIDGAGRFAVPGLINAHAHLFSDGRPLPPILTSERFEGVVSKVFHSPVGSSQNDGPRTTFVRNCYRV